jgi:regulator of protease activity HflC (stomatin/prohibitin superfamily)
MNSSPYYQLSQNGSLAIRTNATDQKSNQGPNQELDYSKKLFDSLPNNAREYYKEKTNKPLSEIITKLSTGTRVWNTLNLLRLYPFLRFKYVNSNELLPVLVSGQHKILQGPGFNWTVGINDSSSHKIQIGSDVEFGPIKLIYVKPGTLKFAVDIATSKPMLLGPGMHYFDDINIKIQSRDIVLSSGGDNQIINVDDNGIFKFVFVKTGSEAIVNSRDGQLMILEAGLHFVEAPDSLKTFASIQQEHFKFGSCDISGASAPVFLTSDNVELHVDATIFYRISDVKKVFTTSIKDKDDLKETLHSQAMSTLMTIIRSENFSNIGKRSTVRKINDNLTNEFFPQTNTKNSSSSSLNAGPFIAEASLVQPFNEYQSVNPSAPPSNLQGKNNETAIDDVSIGFKSIIQDAEPQFKTTMQTNFGDRFGFEIQGLRIEKIEFADKQTQKQVSELAMTYTKLAAQEATIEAQKKVQLAEANRDAAASLIKTKAEADRSIITANALNETNRNKVKTDNDILVETMKAKNQASQLETETLAQNKMRLAEAEADALLKIGNAEIEIIEKKSRLPYAQLRMITDAQKDALHGVNKVIYTTEQSMIMKPFMNLIEKDMQITE